MSRQYRHKAEGYRLPSVSDIVPESYEGCPFDLLQEGQKRGTFVHAASVLLDNDNLDWSSVPENYKPYLKAWELACSELSLKFYPGWSEKPCHSEVIGVAGTPDRIGTMARRLTPTVFDLKTGDGHSNKIKAIWGLRLAGYELIYREISGKHRGKMERFVIQLHSTGKFTPVPLEDPSDHAAFRSFANTYKWKMNKGLL